MAIVLQIGKAGSPFSRIHSTSLQASPELMGCVTAVRHFTNYLQNLRLERGLACIVQSWFFCFQLALPSPFRSCADVKGCEVTARGRYWVGVGRRGGPGQAGPSCFRYAEFLLHWCCLILQRLCRGHVSKLKINCNQKIPRIDQKRASFRRTIILAIEPKRNMLML